MTKNMTTASNNNPARGHSSSSTSTNNTTHYHPSYHYHPQQQQQYPYPSTTVGTIPTTGGSIVQVLPAVVPSGTISGNAITSYRNHNNVNHVIETNNNNIAQVPTSYHHQQQHQQQAPIYSNVYYQPQQQIYHYQQQQQPLQHNTSGNHLYQHHYQQHPQLHLQQHPLLYHHPQHQHHSTGSSTKEITKDINSEKNIDEENINYDCSDDEDEEYFRSRTSSSGHRVRQQQPNTRLGDSKNRLTSSNTKTNRSSRRVHDRHEPHDLIYRQQQQGERNKSVRTRRSTSRRNNRNSSIVRHTYESEVARNDQELQHKLHLQQLSTRDKTILLTKMISEMCFWDFPFKSLIHEQNNTDYYTNALNDAVDEAVYTSYAAVTGVSTTPTNTTTSTVSTNDIDNFSYQNRNSNKDVMTMSSSTTAQEDKNRGRIEPNYVDTNHTNNNTNKKKRMEFENDNLTNSNGTTLDIDPINDNIDENIVIPTSTWKQATDPSTGRIYYYDSITRKTQWEKPKELRTIEKLKKLQQRRLDIRFFREMESNIVASLQRGEYIPNVPSSSSTDTNHIHNTTINNAIISSSNNNNATTTSLTDNNNNIAQRPHSTSPAPSQSATRLVTQKPASIKVRTISGMDQHVLAQLSNSHHIVKNNATSSSTTTSTHNSTISNGQSLPLVVTNGTTGHRVTTGTNNVTTASPTAVAVSGAVGIDGRPPLAQRRWGNSGSLPTSSGNSSGNGSANSVLADVAQASRATTTTGEQTTTTPKHELSSKNHGGCVLTALDSMELSPDPPTTSKTALDMDDDCEMKTPAESLLGVDLLVEDPAHNSEGDSSSLPNNNSTNTNTVTNATMTTKTTTTAHVRRYTGGTMYFDTTMDNPNINATIQCVCGVYRAHIVHSVETNNINNNNNRLATAASGTSHPGIEVFNDDYEQVQRLQPSGQQQQQQQIVIPTLNEIQAFYQEFYQRSQMEHDTIIMSLIYVERLIKATNGLLSPTPKNWRSILFSCMILASKVWDDLSMWNIDFSNVSLAASTKVSAAAAATPSSLKSNSNLLSAFSLQRINQLELAVLTNLNFRTAIPASEYAKYYFLIRTMLLRSGLLLQQHTNINGIGSSNSKGTTTRASSSTTTNFGTPTPTAEFLIEDRTKRYQQLLSNHHMPTVTTMTNTTNNTATGGNTSNSSNSITNGNDSTVLYNGSSGTSMTNYELVHNNRRMNARSVDWSCLESTTTKSVPKSSTCTSTATITDSTTINQSTTTVFASMSEMNVDVDNNVLVVVEDGPVLQETVCLQQMGVAENG